MFVRLVRDRPIVLWIDDLHWGDLDSARIMKSWMEPPGIPGMMLLLSYRSDELSTSPCLRLLSESTARGEPERTIALGPLADEHIQALCLPRFEGALRPAHVHDAIVNHIVLEAGGSPYLASQLATLALNDRTGTNPRHSTGRRSRRSSRGALHSSPRPLDVCCTCYPPRANRYLQSSRCALQASSRPAAPRFTSCRA